MGRLLSSHAFSTRRGLPALGQGIALSPDEKELWVGDRAEATVSVIDAWLRAGIFEEGRRREMERGTPLGGSASPSYNADV